eukprot:TRINITY_DN12795_c0_g1_i6.p3 TRINITY_DN12795_c0_g1~~TRINITY_DN12795_c0_g1_i6.p3  ORF type:complete len:104 (-),score=15.30 TRINITY_DN12795_c0_g1_i6:351-662(-)
MGASQPDYDAGQCAQFLMLGAEELEKSETSDQSSDWACSSQCSKCVEEHGEENVSYFGYVMNRRHHCRKCLKSFCWTHSNNFHQIAPEGPEVRLCDLCASSPL